jgi:hypothetical protein
MANGSDGVAPTGYYYGAIGYTLINSAEKAATMRDKKVQKQKS